MKEQECIFETTDGEGRLVRYRSVIYNRHLPEHPEVAAYMKEAALTINDPDCEIEDEPEAEDSFSRVFYRFGLLRGDYAKLFIKVPVYYTRATSEGEVATIHLARHIGRGKIIWQRNSP